MCKLYIKCDIIIMMYFFMQNYTVGGNQCCLLVGVYGKATQTVLQFISPLVVLFMFVVFNIHNHQWNRLRKQFYWYTSLKIL